jgi:hypothetical protein
MTRILLALGLFLGSHSFAGTWSIKINSFTLLIPGYHLGEICGTVTGPANQFADAKVEIEVDPHTSNPGVYVSNIDHQGNFCHLVNAYSGTATATLWVRGARASNPVLVSGKARTN